MKRSGSALKSAILTALILFSVLVSSGSAAAQIPPAQTSIVTVGYWGQSEINEDGNLRFRITASAGGISWTDPTEGTVAYLQLWAHITGGPAGQVDKTVLIKQKPAYNIYGAATNIAGTSAKAQLKPGKYTYELYVVVADESGNPLGTSAGHIGGTVVLP